MSGVTTARCMGDRFYIDVTLKKLINEGKVSGPKLLAAGIGMKGSMGQVILEARTVVRKKSVAQPAKI